MNKGQNALTEEKRQLLNQGTKVEFKWRGSDMLYTGFIEINECGDLYYCDEHNYKDGELTETGKPMQFYNRLDSFSFFTYFEIIENQIVQELNAEEMLNNLNEMALNWLKEVTKQKSDIFIKRLHDLGIDANLEEEKNRRFKRFQKEVGNNEETIYYDDGSVDGLRIITFKFLENFHELKSTDRVVSIEQAMTYY